MRQILFLAAALAAIGCGGKKPKDAPPPLAQPGSTVVEAGRELGGFTPPTRFEGGIGIHAAAAGPGVMTISVANQNGSGGVPSPADEVRITPDKFAIITGPDRARDLIPLTPKNIDMRSFLPQAVKGGGTGVFQVVLREPIELRGKRLVFRDLQRNVQFYVDIQ
jgi:hypothetical protein